ncbi:hypothetical protein [Aerococcus vaginalis]
MKNTPVGLTTFAVASTVAVTQDIDAKATSVESNVEINKILEDSTDASVKEEFVEEVDVQHDIAEDVINEAHTELKTIETVKGQASNVTHN